MSENKSDEKDKNLVVAEAKPEKSKKAPKAEKAAKSEKKREPISLSKIFATIIIAIIVIALLGTSIIYVIIPSLNKNNEMNFGSYNGEKILYEANSLLYQQYSSLAQQYPDEASSSDISTQYSLWNQAYQNAVILTAVQQMAKESDVRAPQEMIDDAILASGYFNDDDGNFSEALYNEATNETKASLNLAYKQQVPFSIISNDEATVATSQAEQDFVASMASATRTFEYIAVDYSAIPTDIAAEYLNADPKLFKSAGMSDITTTTEENIQAAYAALQSGTEWAEAVSLYSEDSYASYDGAIGTVYYYNLTSICSEEQLESLFSLAKDQYTEPMETSGVWRIFKLDTDVADADINDATAQAHIKNYILTNESESAATYVDEMAAKVGEEAKVDFDNAALDNGLNTVTVSATPGNVGGSSYMGSFSYTDAYGLLADIASTDEDLMKTLYTEEAGYVTDPIQSGSSYIIVKITGTTPDLTQGQTVNLFYSYYGSQMATNDFYSDILSSDKHVDNFITEFLTIFGSDLGLDAVDTAAAN